MLRRILVLLFSSLLVAFAGSGCEGSNDQEIAEKYFGIVANQEYPIIVTTDDTDGTLSPKFFVNATEFDDKGRATWFTISVWSAFMPPSDEYPMGIVHTDIAQIHRKDIVFQRYFGERIAPGFVAIEPSDSYFLMFGKPNIGDIVERSEIRMMVTEKQAQELKL